MELNLTDQARKPLRIYQRNVGSRSAYVKVITLLLIDKGLSPAEISDRLGIDPSTVYRYLSIRWFGQIFTNRLSRLLGTFILR